MTKHNDLYLGPAKHDLRVRFKSYRSSLSEEAYAEKSRQIVDRIASLPEITQAQTIHVYWPMLATREVDIRPLIQLWWQSGKQVVMPVVASFQRDQPPSLLHACYDGPSSLVENRWGIHEPKDGRRVSPHELEVVIVPALGAGRNGHRIGYGFGHYDSFLQAVTAPMVGVLYADCLVEAVPPETHDVPLSILITETEILRLTPS